MLYDFFNVNEIDDIVISKYYHVLSEKRKAVLSAMASGHDRAVALACEKLARSLLCRLLDAPEFSFELLLTPNGRSAVGNYGAFLSLAASGDLVGCAVSERPVGLCLTPRRAFTFAEAQSRFTDAELRYIYAEAGYTFASLISLQQITQPSAVSRFAQYAAVRSAYNRARGRTAGESPVEILRDARGAALSDPAYLISEIGEAENFAFAVVERK